MVYSDRQEAGQKLAKVLKQYAHNHTIILALPRGGVVVGAEVAKALDVPLGVIMVRKIGHPYSQEFAVGAVAEDDQPIYDPAEVKTVDPTWLKLEEEAAREVIDQRREYYYDDDHLPIDLHGNTVILVDDGMATGLTMIAAIEAARHKGAKSVIVAVPVASQSSLDDIEHVADGVYVLDDPAEFHGAVGAHYDQFNQVEDIQVRRILHLQPRFGFGII